VSRAESRALLAELGTAPPLAEAAPRSRSARRCPALLSSLRWGAAGHDAGWGQRLDLPPRLLQLAACLALGDTDRQAAERLGLSLHTVRSYSKRLYRRLGVRSRVQVAARVLEAVGCSAARRVRGAKAEGAGPRCSRTAQPAEQALPPRLRRVAAYAARGLTNEETAGRLGLSGHTVRSYVRQVYAQLGVHNRAELLFAVG